MKRINTMVMTIIIPPTAAPAMMPTLLSPTCKFTHNRSILLYVYVYIYIYVCMMYTNVRTYVRMYVCMT